MKLSQILRFSTSKKRMEMSLENTAPFYKRHLFIATPGQHCWPCHPERDHPIISRLTTLLRPCLASSDLKITLTDANISERQIKDNDKDLFDVLLYPDHVVSLGRSAADIEPLAEIISLHQRIQPNSDTAISFSPDRLSRIFVCTHGERDCRCGTHGSALFHTLSAVLLHDRLRSMIQIHRCSHIGGHKYAANCIVYPNGDWFGHFQGTMEDAKLLVDKIRDPQGRIQRQNSLFKKHWRGTMGVKSGL